MMTSSLSAVENPENFKEKWNFQRTWSWRKIRREITAPRKVENFIDKTDDKIDKWTIDGRSTITEIKWPPILTPWAVEGVTAPLPLARRQPWAAGRAAGFFWSRHLIYGDQLTNSFDAAASTATPKTAQPSPVRSGPVRSAAFLGRLTKRVRRATAAALRHRPPPVTLADQ